MRTHSLRPQVVLLLACLLALLLFLLGISVPQEHVWGSYLLPIVIVFLWGQRRDIYFVTALAGVLAFAGYRFNQPFMLGALLLNYLVPTFVLWGVAWRLARHRQLEDELVRHEHELDEQVTTRTARLQDSEEELAKIFHASPGGLAITRLADDRFLEANNAFLTLVGCTREDLIGRTSLELGIIDAEERARLETVVLAEGCVPVTDLTIHTKCGDTRNVLISVELLAAKGEARVLLSAVDITKRKQAEAALQEANRLLEQRVEERTARLQEERTLLRTVIDTIPDFIYVKDCQHRMLLNNRAYIQSAGMRSSAELLGKTDLDLFPRAMALQFHVDEDHLFASGQPIVNLEEQGIHPDGSEAWMLTTKVPLHNLQGELTGLVGVTRDITAHKAAERVVEAALAHEKELGELKSRLVSMASHEFRNPLAAILGTAEVLALLWEQMDKAIIDDRLNRIQEQALRLTAITDEVLQLTRLQTGYSRFEPAPGNLDELVARVVNELAELPGNQDRICYTCAQQPLPAVFDAHLLQHAIDNLINNALKYSSPEKSVRVTLAQSPGPKSGEITLCIVDEGIGIPARDLPRLFEPFYRAANVKTIQGTGLGLAIVKEAVALHGGSVAVQSQVGVGTTFTITLPA